MLSRQTFINCGATRGGFGDGCDGGDAFDIMEYMVRYGLPDETCQNYMAHDKTCTPEALCANCMFLDGDDEVFHVMLTSINFLSALLTSLLSCGSTASLLGHS
jgi:hypothetical protein